jgi:hypothetical protein
MAHICETLVKNIGLLERYMNMKINGLVENGFTSETADLCNRGACRPPWLWLCPRRVEPSQARWFYPMEEGSKILSRFPWNGDGGSNPGQMLIYFFIKCILNFFSVYINWICSKDVFSLLILRGSFKIKIMHCVFTI